MSELLLYYRRPEPTTWVYMSSFLTIALFFAFHRFWSIRNLDILLLILLAPGLLMVHEGRRREFRDLESEAIAARIQETTSPSVGQQSSFVPADTTEDSDSITSALLPLSSPSLLGAGMLQVDAAEVEAVIGDTKPTAPEASATTEVWDDRKPSGEAATPEPQNSSQGYTPQSLQYYGFIVLFVVQFLILIRLLLDSLMNRRPLLHPNLTSGGLYFIGVSLFAFMMGNVVTSTPRMRVMQGPELGPGYALMQKMPRITTRPVSKALAGAEPFTTAELDPGERRWTMIAKMSAIMAHLAIVCGITLIGSRHFGNPRAGVGAATLYLLLPYTAQMTGRVDHALPAALLLWAILNYRKPLFAGVFFGLSAGLVYFPLFLLPLWISFYWQRGVRRFVVSVVATLAILAMLLSLGGTESFGDYLLRMFGVMKPTMEPQGVWGLGWSPYYRIPVFVGFIILSAFFAIWPSPKNLGGLISCSAALMVAAQFCHGYGGGLFIAWFLPLLLLTVFRPNLQDRVAMKVVEGGSNKSKRTAPLEVQSA